MTAVRYHQDGFHAIPSFPTPQMPTILQYIAEGNANVVYAFETIGEAPLHPNLRNKLLRLRKDKSFIQPTKSQFATYQREIVPLFRPENLVEQALIPLDANIFNLLNQRLHEHERQDLRHGDGLAVDDYGLLMTDMTAKHGEYLFEIKPKWLLQSPDAPQDAIRCRTCALKLQRDHAKANGAVTPSNPAAFCPLRLVDKDVEERRSAFESIVEAQADGLSQMQIKSIVKYLAEKGYKVLLDLHGHQNRLDRHGVLTFNADNISDDYCKAMTLRDCVLFVKGTLNSFETTANVRLADLDFKHAHPDKVEKWKSTERDLISQGWYTHVAADQASAPVCLLARRSL